MSEVSSNPEPAKIDLAGRLPDVRWGLLPILLVPVVVSFWPQSPVLVTEQESQDEVLETDNPDYYMRGAKMSALDDEGKLLYQVRTDELLHYPDDSATASALEMEYFGPEGHWLLTAPQGQAPAGVNELQLSGGVLIKGRHSQNRPLTTMQMDKARLLPAKMQLDTDSPIRMDEAGRRVRATGMIMDIDKDVVKLKKNVRVHHEP